jgi:plastocyanin
MGAAVRRLRMGRSLRLRPVLVLLVAGAIALAAAACGGGSSGGSSQASGAGSPVDVTLKDFSITVAGGTSLAPGTYTFHVTNQGPSAHNLTVNGPGVANEATPTFSSGTKDLTVTLKDGTYDLYCSVPSHKQLGMDTHITVGSGA